ncbi:glycosyltransferase 87 family protein [Curtobacterium ammoniigenes]|uniref:glycosyltransferase 87 family protein n=1 Tax=Curtobacterium ammoniigenes TaxID=395387 RepID=UPI00082B7A1C|nr:glycosyltransferase 87 family protein [Curtobacterium ammoniigenes]
MKIDRRNTRPLSWIEIAVMTAVAVGLTIGSMLHHLPCTVLPGPGVARITQLSQWGCASDVGGMFTIHDYAAHVFPYVSPHADASGLPLGTPEYPTLTAIWIWLTGLPVVSAHGFVIVTALTFLPLVALATIMLARVAGRRAWIFAATPPLYLYALLNWDVIPVFFVSAALFVELGLRDRIPPWVRALIAGALLGIGGAFKLYPALFVCPLVLAYLIEAGVPLARRVRDAAVVAGSAVAVLLAANVPFLVINAAGWWSVIRFQASRPIEPDTLSVWYYALLPWSAQATPSVEHTLNRMAQVATALGLLTVVVIGLVIGIRRRQMPWVQTAAAMICIYMVCNKVDSPQYTLWLLPFFVVVRLRIGWIIAYLGVDLATFVGYFRDIYYNSIGHTEATWAHFLLYAGIAGHIVLLPIIAGVCLASGVARPRAVTDRSVDDPEAPAHLPEASADVPERAPGELAAPLA